MERMKRRIEIIFKNHTRLVIIAERNILERDNRLEIFDIEEHKMFFINIEEIIYYTIKLIGVKNG